MAIPGLSIRTANDVLEEISNHLVEPYVSTTITSTVAPGTATVPVGSVASMYAGAQLVVDTGTNAEIVTIIAVGTNSFTAVFAKTHAINAPVSGATFPIQEATDPIFTQSEMLSYLSRAQNEFLQQVPTFFLIFTQDVTTGVITQSLTETAIELNRVAASKIKMPITSLVRSGNVVTATFPSAHGFKNGGTFWVKNPIDDTFSGVFEIATVPSSTTLTYPQYGADASTTGGTAQYLVRLYEITQEEMNMSNRQWRVMTGFPNGFFEDRQGLYKFGVNALPAYSYPLETLCSVRDTDTLTLLDHFLLPDTMLHFVKYKAMAYAFSKDGVWSDTQRAQYCADRFSRGVAIVQRFIDGMQVGTQGQG